MKGKFKINWANAKPAGNLVWIWSIIMLYLVLLTWMSIHYPCAPRTDTFAIVLFQLSFALDFPGYYLAEVTLDSNSSPLPVEKDKDSQKKVELQGLKFWADEPVCVLFIRVYSKIVQLFGLFGSFFTWCGYVGQCHVCFSRFPCGYSTRIDILKKGWLLSLQTTTYWISLRTITGLLYKYESMARAWQAGNETTTKVP